MSRSFESAPFEAFFLIFFFFLQRFSTVSAVDRLSLTDARIKEAVLISLRRDVRSLAYVWNSRRFYKGTHAGFRGRTRNGEIPVPCETPGSVYVMACRITLFRVVCQSVCAAICNAFPSDAGFVSSSSALQFSWNPARSPSNVTRLEIAFIGISPRVWTTYW